MYATSGLVDHPLEECQLQHVALHTVASVNTHYSQSHHHVYGCQGAGPFDLGCCTDLIQTECEVLVWCTKCRYCCGRTCHDWADANWCNAPGHPWWHCRWWWCSGSRRSADSRSSHDTSGICRTASSSIPVAVDSGKLLWGYLEGDDVVILFCLIVALCTLPYTIKYACTNCPCHIRVSLEKRLQRPATAELCKMNLILLVLSGEKSANYLQKLQNCVGRCVHVCVFVTVIAARESCAPLENPQ